MSAPPLLKNQEAENTMLNDDDAWTVEREARLVYVQGQLRAAQAAWSEEQELWIDEVHHLEDLKRKCWKREKKAKGRATGVAAIWKVKTWGGAGAGAKGKAEDSSAAFVEEPESAVEEDEVEDEEDEEHPSSPRNTNSMTTLFRAMSFSGSKQNSRRNTLDVGVASRRSRRPSLQTTPEGSFEGKGKRNLLMKRRGSGD
ncbi:hypothetical protein XPA_007375 [Xanthoria parietina]